MAFKDIFNQFLGSAFSSSVQTGFGSGLASGLTNLIFNSPEKQMRNQRRLADYQAKLNKDLFDYQYAKELPSVRAQQMKDAGLNPALMYSGSGVSGMNAQMGHSSPTQAPQMDLMTNSNPLAVSQIRNIDADTAYKEQTTKTEEKNTLLKEIELLQAEYNFKEITPLRKQEIEATLAEKWARVRNLDSQTDLNEQEYGYRTILNKYGIEEKKADAMMKGIKAKYVEKYHEDMPTTNLSNVFGILVRAVGGNKNFNWSALLENGGKLIDFIKEKWREAHSGENPTDEQIQQTATALEYLITHRDDPAIEKIFRADLK